MIGLHTTLSDRATRDEMAENLHKADIARELAGVDIAERQLAIDCIAGRSGDVRDTNRLGSDGALSVEVVGNSRYGARVRHSAAGQVNGADTQNTVLARETCCPSSHADRLVLNGQASTESHRVRVCKIDN